MSSNYAPPTRTAHGLTYWLIIGWWWAPVKWAGRVVLWLFVWPLGLWRSLHNSHAKQDARMRRGYKKASK